MNPLHPLLAITLASSAAFAQQVEPQAAWREFQAHYGPGFSAEWNPATGTPAAIFGTGVRVTDDDVESIEDARPSVEKLLAKHAALLGRGASKFVEIDTSHIRHLLYFIYAQEFGGLEVRGARADVRMNVNGVVSMFGASAVQIPADFDTRPKISEPDARRRAALEVLGTAAKNPPQPGRLMIWAEPFGKAPTSPVLAWEIQIDERPHQVAVGKAFIDARTGKLIEYDSEVFTCGSCQKTHVSKATPFRKRLDRARDLADAAENLEPAPAGNPLAALTGKVMAWTNTGHKPIDTLKNIPLRNVLVTAANGNSAYTNDKGEFSITNSGTTAVNCTVTLTGRHSQRVRVATGTQFSVTQAVTPGTPATLQIGTSTMDHLGHSQTTTYHFVDDVNEWVRSILPTKTSQMATMSTMNPRVNINSSCNAYYTGYTINFYNPSSTCNMTAFRSVIYHEWGHGLDHVFGGIIRTDGLSEGWADVIAILREQYPIVGDYFRKNGTYVRTALNTLKYPTGSTSVHTQGQVWMGWVWDVRTDLLSTIGNEPAAQAIMEKIVVPSIVANASTMTQQIREVFLLDDDDGNLANGTPHYASLEKACKKRTVTYPEKQLGYLTHSPLRSTSKPLAPRLAFAEAVALSGSFTKLTLTYNSGSGATSVEMVPSGKTNQFVAALPGISGSTQMQYYIVANHSAGETFRVPSTGTYLYEVGNEDVYWSDDFETDLGWTTGILTTGAKNDFTRGAPSGASGTTWNSTTWSDPNGAFSGKYCWGNNMNGAYGTGLNCYLRSPKINLSGKTNVRLQFMRWLQVQQSAYDTAQLLLNGTVIWSNDYSSTHKDTGWTKFDVAVPAANNNPSVQLEFRLKSDGGMELSGWNIDDVKFYQVQQVATPKVQFLMSSPQIGVGKSGSATIIGSVAASRPIFLLISNLPGPTKIPGFPQFEVGFPFAIFPGATDSTGKMAVPFTVPNDTSSIGMVHYAHAIEQTSGSVLTPSNGTLLLMGK